MHLTCADTCADTGPRPNPPVQVPFMPLSRPGFSSRACRRCLCLWMAVGGKRRSWKGLFVALSPGLFVPSLPSRLCPHPNSAFGNFWATPGQLPAQAPAQGQLVLLGGGAAQGGPAVCCACLSIPGQKSHNVTTLPLTRVGDAGLGAQVRPGGPCSPLSPRPHRTLLLVLLVELGALS